MTLNAFIHQPKNLNTGVFVSPTHTKALWAKVWAAARAQDWFSENVSLVGNADGYFYFQKRGLTTGFARVKVQ